MTATEFMLIGGGRLDESWFLPLDAESLVQQWLDDATGNDKVRTARVYARAFTFLSDRAMSQPASQRDRTKQESFTSDQLNYWWLQARRYEGELDALLHGSGPRLVDWEGKAHGSC